MVEDPKSHIDGEFETVKHRKRKEAYYKALPQILDLGHSKEDLLHHFPAFVGSLTLSRLLTLVHLYRKVEGVAGHIIEVGVYKGAGSILFGKLVNLFEPDSLTMVHGFDHFSGTDSDTDSELQVAGGNHADEQQLRKLIELQELGDTIKIHNLDVRTELTAFFEKHPHLRFKLAFIDSGTRDVTYSAIWEIWPRLERGGIIIFDQYAHEVAPGETSAVQELLTSQKVQTLPNSWMPNAYVVKP